MRGHQEEDQHDYQREGEAEGAEAAERGRGAGAVEAGGGARWGDDDGGEEGGAFVVGDLRGHGVGSGMDATGCCCCYGALKSLLVVHREKVMLSVVEKLERHESDPMKRIMIGDPQLILISTFLLRPLQKME